MVIAAFAYISKEEGWCRLKLRAFRAEDCAEIIRLFQHTVHTVNKADYSQPQLDAWAPRDMDEKAWKLSLLAHYTIVAELDGKIAGFGDIDRGYLDRLYVHRAYQRRGVATAIAAELENHARQEGCFLVTTHASVTALPFFQQRGYLVLKEQQVERHGVLLSNFVMEKHLK